MHLRILLIFPFMLWNITLGAESKNEWQRAVDTLERNSVRSLQPVNELLLNELTEQQKAAQHKNDLAKLAQLDSLLTQVHARKVVLDQGRMWIPQRQEAEWEIFCRENYGKKWHLSGTQNVRQFRIENRGLITINSKGEEFFKQHIPSIIPGVFVSRRTDRGASIYIVSPDSKQAMCLVTPKFYENVTLPPAIPSSQVRDSTLAPLSTDLLEILTGEIREKQLQYETQLLRLLESHFAQVITTRSRNDIHPLHQRMTESRRAIHYYVTPPTTDTKADTQETYAKAIQLKTWSFPTSRTHQKLQFNGMKMLVSSTDGMATIPMPTQIIWPGLLLLSPPTGSPSYLLISPDLQEALLIPTVTMKFTGGLVE